MKAVLDLVRTDDVTAWRYLLMKAVLDPVRTFSVWTEFTVLTGKKESVLPRGILLVTRLLVSSEQAREPVANRVRKSSARFCSNPSTVPRFVQYEGHLLESV
jgi:hypothetical protein